MTICAIIAEYNPMHEGHLYHIAQTKARLGEDAYLIAVMGGHVTQRGLFPILDKSARTRMALQAGFDLVFELPAPYACAPAERFARGAVGIIAKLGCVTHLSFGAETENLEELQELSMRLPEVYPKDKTLAAAYPEAFPDAARLFTPNNILALEYLRALHDLAPKIEPVAIGRQGSNHDGYGSALAVRRRILKTGRIPRSLPFSAIWNEEISFGRAPISLRKQEGAILSSLRRMTAVQYLPIADVGAGGLAQRLHAAASTARTLPELYQTAKTKRYTMARIRRCVIAAFLGLTEEMAQNPPHLRLLGIGARGSDVLSQISEPIISRPAAHREALLFESAVTDQLTLCMPIPEAAGSEWRRHSVKRI